MTQSPIDTPEPTVGDVPEVRRRGLGRTADRRRLVLRLLAVVGVAVPVLLTAWYASELTLSFDGAMNLQVARNVADGDGYRWNYGAKELFPAPIQTSGLFIFVAAAFIKILGPTSFAYQAANVVFVLILAIAVSLGLRHWPVLRAVGPAVVLFGTPGALAAAGLLGYGELPVASLAILGFVLLDIAATSGRRPALTTAAAACLVGLALTIKVVAAMALPVLVLGAALVALLRRDTRWWKVLLGVLGVLPPVILFELYRLAALRGDYLDWWREQFNAIGYQAGAGYQAGVGEPVGAMPGRFGWSKVADHLQILAAAVGVPVTVLVPLLVLPVVALTALFLTRRRALLMRLHARGVVLLVLVSVYAGGYLVWWLAITPTEKAWLRRIAVGLVSFVIACLLLTGVISDRLRAGADDRRLTRALVSLAACATVAALVLGVFAARPTARTLLASARSDTTRANLAATREAGRTAQALAAAGATLYGVGWWSAPAVSLYSNVSFRDLSTVKYPCALRDEDAYVVWDRFARTIGHPVPRRRGFSFEPVPEASNSYAAVFRVRPGGKVRCAR